VEENKDVAHAWLAARNAHDIEAGVALWAEEKQIWLRAAFERFTLGFPDLHVTVKDIIGEGYKVAVWWILQGTHLGTFRGIPATGKTVNWEVCDLYVIADGKIASLVRRTYYLSLYQQFVVAE
jgi:steroid delta-isomerase-like uncharacterized protein